MFLCGIIYGDVHCVALLLSRRECESRTLEAMSPGTQPGQRYRIRLSQALSSPSSPTPRVCSSPQRAEALDRGKGFSGQEVFTTE